MKEQGFKDLVTADDVAKISIVGAGIQSAHPVLLGIQRGHHHDGNGLHAGLARVAFAQCEVAVALDEVHRHAALREFVRQLLQGDGLARPGGAGDAAMAIGQRRQ